MPPLAGSVTPQDYKTRNPNQRGHLRSNCWSRQSTPRWDPQAADEATLPGFGRGRVGSQSGSPQTRTISGYQQGIQICCCRVNPLRLHLDFARVASLTLAASSRVTRSNDTFLAFRLRAKANRNTSASSLGRHPINDMKLSVSITREECEYRSFRLWHQQVPRQDPTEALPQPSA